MFEFAGHFVFYALNEAILQLGKDLVQRGGLRIITTLDVDLQKQVECVARTHIDRLSGLDPSRVVLTSDNDECKAAAYLPPVASKYVGVDRNASNVAAIVQDPRTGEILPMLGSYDYWNREIDMYRILTASKDTYVTNKIINNSFRATDANVGQAGTLDLFKLYAESTTGSNATPTELSRAP